MTIVLDTTVFRADPYFKSTEMIKLRKLCKDKKIKLVIPQIVKQEYFSQEEEFIDTAKGFFKNVETRLSKVTDKDERTLLESVKTKTNEIIKESKESINKRIDNFLAETHAIVKLLTLDEYNSAFDRYFDGDEPFPTKKSRKDIPDSLIFVQTLNLRDDDIVVISNDKNLRSCLGKRFETFKILSDFINSDEIKRITDIRSIDELLYQKLKSEFDFDNKEFCELAINSLENELENKEIHDDNIPDDNNEGTITGINGIDGLDFQKAEIHNLGDGFFTIPFTCIIDANVKYYYFKSDYYCLDEATMKNIYTEDWNDHYFLAEENFCINCSGKIGLRFEEDASDGLEVSPASILELIKDAEMSFSEFEFEIQHV
jgi:rRNA-processing protein FCF1